MLSPEEVIERAKKWEEIFQYKDEKKPVKGVITKKLKVSYRIYIPKWDVEGRLITKNKTSSRKGRKWTWWSIAPTT